MSRTVRETLFESLSREGRKQKTQRFDDFLAALRGVLD